MKRLNLIDKALMLKKTSLFGSLDLDLLLTISDQLYPISFEPQETIFHIEQEAHRMYLIASGEVEIKNQQQEIVTILSPLDFFGDESLFNEKPRAYTAISRGETLLLGLSRTHLITIISECPNVALRLLTVYSSLLPFRFSKNQGLSI